MATLYRCRTPTNVLCPCGRVERELRKAGVEHATVRVAQRRSHRPEVEEVSGQARVPVVVLDDGDVIADSRRIVEHLRADAAA